MSDLIKVDRISHPRQFSRVAGSQMQSDENQLMRKRNCCPGCSSTSFTSLYRLPFSDSAIKKYIDTQYKGKATRAMNGFDYELVQCAACNLVYQLYVPTDSLLSEIYDVWIPETAREDLRVSSNLDEYRYLSEQVQFIIQHFHLPPHEINVLDFGFGWAEWAKMAMAFGCEVSGSELSKERIEYARSIGLKVVDTQHLPVKRFHFINTEQVFEHLVEPRIMLAHLTKSLRVGGIIKISVPNSNSSLRKLKRTQDYSSLSSADIMSIAPLEHINAFNHESLVALANSVGLKLFKPNIHKLYNSSSGWFEIKNFMRLIIRPFYRHVYPKSTFAYFVLAQSETQEKHTEPER